MSRRGHKYGAVATTIDGIRFASKAEAQRYAELRLMERGGLIRKLECQPKFPLSAKVADAPVSVIVGHYIADFSYESVEIDEGGFSGRLVRVIEDVKGVRTALYRWKRKHFEAQYGLTITEIGRPARRRGVGRRKVLKSGQPGKSKSTNLSREDGGPS